MSINVLLVTGSEYTLILDNILLFVLCLRIGLTVHKILNDINNLILNDQTYLKLIQPLN